MISRPPFGITTRFPVNSARDRGEPSASRCAPLEGASGIRGWRPLTQQNALLSWVSRGWRCRGKAVVPGTVLKAAAANGDWPDGTSRGNVERNFSAGRRLAVERDCASNREWRRAGTAGDQRRHDPDHDAACVADERVMPEPQQVSPSWPSSRAANLASAATSVASPKNGTEPLTVAAAFAVNRAGNRISTRDGNADPAAHELTVSRKSVAEGL